ncbi:MAG TPA: hypothetical protein VJ901_11690 [Thermoanaerobaculia bacterium]|nr:hypothetical protein [Thermoanaerobaculia bacterium]
MRRISVRCLIAIALAIAADAAQPAEPVWFVPWKVLSPGDAPPAAAQLVVYWLPASRDDMRHSELLTSRTLTLFSSQCVAMYVVRPDDFERISKLGAMQRSPVVLLLDSDDRELTHIESESGALRIATVERVVRDEVHAREDEAEKLLDEARAKSESGEKNAAITMYRHVFDQRCLLPRQARTAQRALRKLGIDVE